MGHDDDNEKLFLGLQGLALGLARGHNISSLDLPQVAVSVSHCQIQIGLRNKDLALSWIVNQFQHRYFASAKIFSLVPMTIFLFEPVFGVPFLQQTVQNVSQLSANENSKIENFSCYLKISKVNCQTEKRTVRPHIKSNSRFMNEIGNILE